MNPKPGLLPSIKMSLRFRDSIGNIWERVETGGAKKLPDDADIFGG